VPAPASSTGARSATTSSPEHRELFAYLDDEQRLRPDVRDLYERQANQAAIELLASRSIP
jgi:hypothetical protein